MEKLNKYNKKRNFNKTNEPVGKSEKPKTKTKAGAKLRFAVQHHLARRDHYDFRLEWEGVLLSWAVPKGPSFNSKDKRLAIHVEDHPLSYRAYEGTIPKGQYGGGVVMLWDEGWWIPYGDVNKGLKQGTLKFALNGKRLKGDWALIRLQPKEKQDEDNWILLKEKDNFAKTEKGISNFNTSIKTGRTMTEIEDNVNKKLEKNPFKKTELQLAKLKVAPPDTDEWIYEMKYDGYRIVAYLENNKAMLFTRNNKDFTPHFKEIANTLSTWSKGRAMVLDGEMAIVDEEGKTDFQLLQNYIKKTNKGNLTYIIFDILALDGEDLRQQPLTKRKDILERLMKKAPDNLHFSQHIKGNGKNILESACEMKLEGIIAKKANSPYSKTRNDDWIKLKCNNRQEFVIGGYVKTEKKVNGVSSLLLGYYENDKLIYAGRVGTGMTDGIREELENKLKKIAIKTCPFSDEPKPAKSEKLAFVKPLMIAEVQFLEWTHEGLLRQASFKGLRQDKKPKNVVLENNKTAKNSAENSNSVKSNVKKVSKPKLKTASKTKTNSKTTNSKSKITKQGKDYFYEDIKITSADKVVYKNPKLTKLDVIKYYEKVADRMLPFVANRVISIVRCPQGFASQCFFKKHPDSAVNGIVPIMVANSEGEEAEYFYIENERGLIYEAQMNTLEFHTWGSKVSNINKPDLMVFDLDPHEGMELDQIRQGVKDLKSILNKLKLKSFLKTSGGKGYHVVVPFKPSANWKDFYEFAKTVAKIMEETWPERYTSNMRKVNRKNKIFIDWVRNGKGATSVAPYSLRAREGATVSMPISWRELDTVAPNEINMQKALLRLKKPDPWKNFLLN